MYTAHYDHFGIDRTRKGDPIFHGAADNGTGTAIVMEMARAWGMKKIQPPSTVILRRRHGRGAGPAGIAVPPACIRRYPRATCRST